MTIYETAEDISAISELINSLIDEETGEARELTDEEKQTFLVWVKESEGKFNNKFDNICKFYKNLKATAEAAETERKLLSDEMSRLSKRAKARENEANGLKNLIWFAFSKMKIKKHKTDLFSAGIQNTKKTAKTDSLFDPALIPIEFLNQELSSSKINEAINKGDLYEKEKSPGRLFYKDEAGKEKELAHVFYSAGEALVIR